LHARCAHARTSPTAMGAANATTASAPAHRAGQVPHAMYASALHTAAAPMAGARTRRARARAWMGGAAPIARCRRPARPTGASPARAEVDASSASASVKVARSVPSVNRVPVHANAPDTGGATSRAASASALRASRGSTAAFQAAPRAAGATARASPAGASAFRDGRVRRARNASACPGAKPPGVAVTASRASACAPKATAGATARSARAHASPTAMGTARAKMGSACAAPAGAARPASSSTVATAAAAARAAAGATIARAPAAAWLASRGLTVGCSSAMTAPAAARMATATGSRVGASAFRGGAARAVTCVTALTIARVWARAAMGHAAALPAARGLPARCSPAPTRTAPAAACACAVRVPVTRASQASGVNLWAVQAAQAARALAIACRSP
jgi:hypothetical protein